jgi:hypothetical protein
MKQSTTVSAVRAEGINRVTARRLAGTYRYELCPGRSTLLLTLDENGSFALSLEACVSQFVWARGHFMTCGNGDLQLIPYDPSSPGIQKYTAYRVRDNGSPILLGLDGYGEENGRVFTRLPD